MSGRLAELFEKVTVMHSTPDWQAAHRDLAEVMGPATLSDGQGWASFPPLSLSDEPGAAWSLLAKARDLSAVAGRAAALGWRVADVVSGAHEKRLALQAPSGLTVIAYAPARPASEAEGGQDRSAGTPATH